MFKIFLFVTLLHFVYHQPQLHPNLINQQSNPQNDDEQKPSTSTPQLSQQSHLISPHFDQGLRQQFEIDFSDQEVLPFFFQQQNLNQNIEKSIYQNQLQSQTQQQQTIQQSLSQLNQRFDTFQQQMTEIQANLNSQTQLFAFLSQLDFSSHRIQSPNLQESQSKRKHQQIYQKKQETQNKQYEIKKRRQEQASTPKAPLLSDFFEQQKPSTSKIVMVQTQQTNNQQKKTEQFCQMPIIKEVLQVQVTPQIIQTSPKKKTAKTKWVNPQSQHGKKMKQIKQIEIPTSIQKCSKIYISLERKLKTLKKQITFQKGILKSQKNQLIRKDLKRKIEQMMKLFQLIQRKMQQVRLMKRWLQNPIQPKPTFSQIELQFQQTQEVQQTHKIYPKISKSRRQLIQRCIALNEDEILQGRPSWIIAKQDYLERIHLISDQNQKRLIQRLPWLTHTQADILGLKLVICQRKIRNNYAGQRTHATLSKKQQTKLVLLAARKELVILKKQFFGQNEHQQYGLTRRQMKTLRQLHILDQSPTQDQQQTLKLLIQQVASFADLTLFQQPVFPQTILIIQKVVKHIAKIQQQK